MFTSLPILWSEADGVAERLGAPGPRAADQPAFGPHWARGVLEERRQLVPLDTLLAPELAPGLAPGLAGELTHGALADLVIAQPRPLEPAENVGLDAWVRGGGHVLLFADPLLTAESRFALGDPRRPADTVLLDPLLAHWGLVLKPGESGSAGAGGKKGGRENAGTPIPVSIPVSAPGVLALLPGGPAGCHIEQAGLMAQCRIGRGTALIVADAALLDRAEGPPAAARARALRRLLQRAFPI